MEFKLDKISGYDYRTVKEWSVTTGKSRAAIGNWIRDKYIDCVDIRGKNHVVLTQKTKNFKGRRNGGN